MWESEQREVVLRWLEVGDSKSYQEDKLELLRNPNHCSEGTGQWLTKSHQIRSWLQFGRGHSVLWLHGKPGSGNLIKKTLRCASILTIHYRQICSLLPADLFPSVRSHQELSVLLLRLPHQELRRHGPGSQKPLCPDDWPGP